jgi:hypothetical protein
VHGVLSVFREVLVAVNDSECVLSVLWKVLVAVKDSECISEGSGCSLSGTGIHNIIC